MAILTALVPLTVALEIPSVIASTLGVLFVFTGFMGICFQVFHAKDERYLFFNTIGSLLLFGSLLISSITGGLGAIPLCILQVIWGGVSAYKWRSVRLEKAMSPVELEQSKLGSLSVMLSGAPDICHDACQAEAEAETEEPPAEEMRLAAQVEAKAEAVRLAAKTEAEAV